jgi:xylose isomerase
VTDPDEFFVGVGPIAYGGPDSDDPMTFRWYDADRVVAGKRMEDHLRMAVCYWHSFVWPGSDIFGQGTLDRPWNAVGLDPLAAARHKMAAAFEFFAKLGTPFFTFHDRDMAPEGATPAESAALLAVMVEEAAAQMERTGVGLLWGTANLFSHPRYAAGAATNPDPDVFAVAVAQVGHSLEATHALGGANYVLWGGREGYETLLNTDLVRAEAQMARFLHLVVEHKHRIGFSGTILIEPKPAEPAKHQYDHDAATVVGFLERHGLADEVRLNLEANHATLAGHSFHHEVATALAAGTFGSIDANRGDPQNGWDTDQFPNSVEECTLALFEILASGGFTTGGVNFDTKLRRQSVARDDLFCGHIGAMDIMARSLLAASSLLESGDLARFRKERYAGWDGPLGARILDGSHSLVDLRTRVEDDGLDPFPR